MACPHGSIYCPDCDDADDADDAEVFPCWCGFFFAGFICDEHLEVSDGAEGR